MYDRKFIVVRLFDPAILWQTDANPHGTKTEWSIAREGLPVTKPGAALVRFECVELSREQRIYVSRGSSPQEQQHRAFACGVRRVIGADDREVFRAATGDQPGHVAMSDKEMDASFHWRDLEDVGAQVILRSEIPFDCAPRYAALPTSLRVLDAIESSSRSAEPSQASAAATPSAPAAVSEA